MGMHVSVEAPATTACAAVTAVCCSEGCSLGGCCCCCRPAAGCSHLLRDPQVFGLPQGGVSFVHCVRVYQELPFFYLLAAIGGAAFDFEGAAYCHGKLLL